MSTEILLEDKHEKQFVTFRLNEKIYGIDILEVESIERMTVYTRLPKSSPYILGVINLRGDILPIISLRSRMEIETKDFDDETRIIMINIDGCRVGIVVDCVLDVLSIAQKHIVSDDILLHKAHYDIVKGVIKNSNSLITILDTDNILELPKK